MSVQGISATGAGMAKDDQEIELRDAADPDPDPHAEAMSPADLVLRMEYIALAQGIDLGDVRAVAGMVMRR